MCAAECSGSVLPLLHKDSDRLLQACCLSGAKTAQSSNSREEWLHSASVSASALFPTTGGHYPALLCLCYGKRAHITTGEELADNYMGWRGAKTHSGQITQATTEGMRGGLIRQGWGEAKRQYTSTEAASLERRLLCFAPKLK